MLNGHGSLRKLQDGELDEARTRRDPCNEPGDVG